MLGRCRYASCGVFQKTTAESRAGATGRRMMATITINGVMPIDESADL